LPIRNGRVLVRDLTSTIIRGDKIGLIGSERRVANPPLIKLLLGQLAPTAARSRTAPISRSSSYYDQLAAQIADDKSVADNIANGNTTVTIEGPHAQCDQLPAGFSLHTRPTPDTAGRVLSGGERNRFACSPGSSPSRPMCSCSTSHQRPRRRDRSNCSRTLLVEFQARCCS